MLKYYKNIFLLLLKSNITPTNESNKGKNDVLGEISGDKEILLGLNEIEKVFDNMQAYEIDKETREKFLKKWLGNDLGKIDEENSGLADKLVAELVNKLDEAKADKVLIKNSVKNLLSLLKDELKVVTSEEELDKLAGKLQADGTITTKESEIVGPGDNLPPKKEKEVELIDNNFNTPSEFLEKVKGNIGINIKLTKILSQLEKEIDKYKVEDYPKFIEGLELIIKDSRKSENNDKSKLFVEKVEVPSIRAKKLIDTLNNKKAELSSIVKKEETSKIEAPVILTNTENLSAKDIVNNLIKGQEEKDSGSKGFSVDDIFKKTKATIVEKTVDNIPELRPKPDMKRKPDVIDTDKTPTISPFNKQIENILVKSGIDLNNFTKEDAISILDKYKVPPYSKDFWKKDEAYPLTIAIQFALRVEPIDGKFGHKTKKAVIDFQKANELHGYKNGAAGPITINAILEKLNSN